MPYRKLSWNFKNVLLSPSSKGVGGAFCAGLDLKHTAALEGDNPLGELDFPENGDPARGAVWLSRLELDKPVIAPR